MRSIGGSRSSDPLAKPTNPDQIDPGMFKSLNPKLKPLNPKPLNPKPLALSRFVACGFAGSGLESCCSTQVTWGHKQFGGDSTHVQEQLRDAPWYGLESLGVGGLWDLGTCRKLFHNFILSGGSGYLQPNYNTHLPPNSKPPKCNESRIENNKHVGYNYRQPEHMQCARTT